MDAIVGGIKAISTYLYTNGEAIVVGTGNVLTTTGQSLVAVGKALFFGIGIGG